MRIPQTFVKSNGQTSSSETKYCEKCGGSALLKEQSPDADFDESGWFYRINYTCRKPTCGHKFTTRIMAQQNGRTLR